PVADPGPARPSRPIGHARWPGPRGDSGGVARALESVADAVGADARLPSAGRPASVCDRSDARPGPRRPRAPSLAQPAGRHGGLMATRVLMILLAAADVDLIRRWAAEGPLPTFARLEATALRARVENPFGLYVGALWPSFYTGLSPARHGRYAFTQLVPGT